jgi:acyl carrier protein
VIEGPYIFVPPREQVIETVIDIFVRVIGFIERKDVFPTTNGATDFYIDTDDLSFFAEAVEKHFDIKTPPSEEWPANFESTMEGIADFVLYHLSKKTNNEQK